MRLDTRARAILNELVHVSKIYIYSYVICAFNYIRVFYNLYLRAFYINGFFNEKIVPNYIHAI